MILDRSILFWTTIYEILPPPLQGWLCTWREGASSAKNRTFPGTLVAELSVGNFWFIAYVCMGCWAYYNHFWEKFPVIKSSEVNKI